VLKIPKPTAAVLLALFAILGAAEVVPAVRESLRDKSVDIVRQWTTLQYVTSHVNPYPVALDALRATYGVLAPRGPVHLRDTRIFDIPPIGPHPDTNRTLGPPEATYPPTAMIAMLPLAVFNVDLLRVAWLVMNLALLALVARELALLTGATGLSSALILAIVAAWPPAMSCVGRQQFSLLVLWSVLVAQRVEGRNPVLSGALYSLALIKPSVAIPFLLLPLAARRAAVLATVGVTQLALLRAMSAMVHEGPVRLLREWISVAAYFRQGMYTSQDIVNGLRLDGTMVDFAVPIGWLIVAYLVGRRLDTSPRFEFLSLVSCVWVYHGVYDFVAMLVPVTLLIRGPLNIRWAMKAAALLLIGLGLTPMVSGGLSLVSRGVRWATRMSIATMIIILAQDDGPAPVAPTCHVISEI
jgi:glycosyl transferase family 87